MGPTKEDDKELYKWMNERPSLRSLLHRLRRLEEDREDLDLSALERSTHEVVRAIGRDSFEQSLQRREASAFEAQKKPDDRLHGTKKLIFKSLFGNISVNERLLRRGSSTVRPLALLLHVHPRGQTLLLQRMAVDFAAEGAFEGASQRLRRHHGVSLSAGCVRKITLEHASAMHASETPSGTLGGLPEKGAEALVAEMDGSMLPIVETGPRGKGRKQRKCHWKEYRLCAARCRGEARTHYGVSAGEVDEAGFTLAQVAARAGWALNTKLQCVADGAQWIQRQWRGNFGTEARFLLDLYHLCEYLAAAKSAHTHGRWLDVQKARLKRNRHDLALKSLRAFAESPDIADEEAPVRTAIRYLSNHSHCLDYAGAIADELPLGSGLIESGHRHVLQKRLKIAGAWWLRDNALSMAHLRVLRAKEAEDAYWQSIWKKAAG